MTPYTRKYLPNDQCPEAPEEIRGRLHATAPQVLKDQRIEWIKARLLEKYTRAAIANRLGIAKSSVHSLIQTHAPDILKTSSASYLAYMLGISGGSGRRSFDLASPKVQAAVIDRALKDGTQILPAAFTLLAEALEK